MKPTWRMAALAAALLAVPAFAGPPVPTNDRPKVQIALLLDTSSSMDGMIAQAKEQLWKIVNTFATANRGGKKPSLQIALYEYGKSTLPAEGGYIRQILPLTEDLDRVSEELFALRTTGGDEFCGQVIQKATQQLAWSQSKEDLKLIYIAGNEPFTQGPVKYQTAVKAAIEHGIVVNTIHCGTEEQGLSGKWKDAAMLADGSFMTIDQNRAVAHVAAPQDKEIARLGVELNKTYIGYGPRGGESAARQSAQDSNAMGVSLGSATQRAVSKASAHYDNSGWDLVDGTKKGAVKMEEMKDADLPEEMRKLDAEGRKTFLAEKAKQRGELQKQINALNDERNKYVAAEAKKRSEEGASTLDQALIESAQAQGKKKAFSF
jgi:hypothetical protein